MSLAQRLDAFSPPSLPIPPLLLYCLPFLLQVSIARCDSHELFRTVQDVRAVVVLLRRGGSFLPQPHQLATSLRSQPEGNGLPGDSSSGGSDQPMFD